MSSSSRWPPCANLPIADRQREEFRQACIEAAGCYKSPKQAQAEIDTLEQRLLDAGRETITINAGKSAPQTIDITPTAAENDAEPLDAPPTPKQKTKPKRATWDRSKI
jgi:hypothetical protein